jgi:S1-C subfamily serine protease
MIKKLWRVLPVAAAAIVVVFSAVTVYGAQAGERRIMTFEQGEVFFLPELGAVILKGDDGLTIEMAPPAANRPKAYREVDLTEQDLIMMFNGKRMKTIADMQSRYDSLAVGGDIRLGIKRGKEMRIVSFAKIDQSKMPQTHQIMLGGDADSAEAQATGAPQKQVMMSWSGGAGGGEIVALPELGLVFTEEDSAVVVASILPNAAAIFKENTPVEGDILKSIGEQVICSVKKFHELYEKIAVGQTVKLRFVHNKKETTVAVEKTEAPEQKMIIKKKG